MQPILFKAGTTTFDSLGLGIIPDVISDQVHEVENGAFTVELTIPKSSRFFNLIEPEMLVKLKPNSVVDYDIFKVTGVGKDSDSAVATVYCSQWTVEANNYFVKKMSVDGQTPQSALGGMQVDRECNFKFTSDITEPINGTDVVYENKNPNEIILGESNSLQKITGGLVRRHLNTVSLLKNDKPNSIRLRRGKNINGLSINRSLDGLVTKIVPYVTIKGEDDQPDTVEYGSEVISPNFGKYKNQYVLPVDYSGRADNVTDMQVLANKYFRENKNIDVPAYDVQVNVADYGSLRKEKVRCGDIAILYDPDYDLDVELEIYDTTYSSVLEEDLTISAGTQAVDLFHNLESLIEKNKSDIDDARNEAGDKIEKFTDEMNVRIDDRTQFGPTTPTGNHKQGDIWYRSEGELGTGEVQQFQMYIYDNGSWVLAFPEGYDVELRKKVNDYTSETDKAISGITADITANAKAVEDEMTDIKNGQIATDKVVASKMSTADVTTLVGQTASGLTGQITAVDGKVTTLGATVDGLQTTVSGTDGLTSKVTQLANLVDTKVSSADLSARITAGVDAGLATVQLTSGVSGNDAYLRLTSNGSMSEVSLGGDKIHITGETRIDNAVIKSANIESINAAKLVGGEIRGISLIYIKSGATAAVMSPKGFSFSKDGVEQGVFLKLNSAGLPSTTVSGTLHASSNISTSGVIKVFNNKISTGYGQIYFNEKGQASVNDSRGAHVLQIV